MHSVFIFIMCPNLGGGGGGGGGRTIDLADNPPR